MLLSEPSTTNYDLNFSIFNFQVRVHPAFFIFPLLLGSRYMQIPDINPGIALLVVAAVFFVSILVHELGHTFAFRYYGIHSRIVLYWMGGLAIPDSGNVWSRPSNGSLNPHQQIVVSLAGPVAGLLLAGLLMAVTYAMGGRIVPGWYGVLPSFQAVLPEPFVFGHPVWLFMEVGIFANVFLNLLNLVPVYPLDGGQIARQIFIIKDPWKGVRNSIIVSVGVAGLIALLSLMNGDRFLGVFFGVMAWSNYMSLQQTGGGYGGGYGTNPW